MKSTTKFSILAAIIVASFLSQSASALTNIDTCGTLNVANEIYNLTANVNNESNCLIIGADNLTIEGNGFQVNYSYSTVGYGVNNSGGYDNITIKNLNIIRGNLSVNNSYAIYGLGISNSTITNNTITTSNNNGWGIYLFPALLTFEFIHLFSASFSIAPVRAFIA